MEIFKHSSQQAGGSGTTPPPPANDEKLFKAIKSQTRFEKLHSRFSQKDFVQENERWRLVAVVTSYLINALSISGAFYGAFSLFQWFGAGREISGALALVLLALVEIARRWAADGIWDKWFHVGKVAGGLLALNIALFAISASSSGYGIYTGIEDSAPPPQAIQDSTLNKMEAEAAAIRSDIETAKKTKWKGTVTVDAQRTIKSSSKSLATLTDAITERRAALSSKQEATEQEHRLTVQHVGMIAVCIYLLLEIVFQVCIRFVSYYDWREYILRTEQGQKSLTPTPTAAAVQIDPQTLAALMANAKTGGFYPLNFVNPAFQDFMQAPGNFGAQKPPQFDPQNGVFENELSHLASEYNGETDGAQIDPQKPPQIVEVPTDIFIVHVNRLTRQKTKMNITQVRRNLSANVSRLKKATDKEAAANIQQQVNYWRGKEAELIEKYRKLEAARKG